MLKLAVLCFVCLTPSMAWGQSTLNVPSAAYPTIQSAIIAAMPGDTVLVAPGIYLENLFFPAKDFHLLGAGAGQSIIDGNMSGSCLRFLQPVTNAMVVEGFTLRNGSGELDWLGATMVPSGGGIHIFDSQFPAGPLISPIIKDCEITQNSATQGGGLYVRFGGEIKLYNCWFHNNIGGGANAIRALNGFTNLEVVDCVFENHIVPSNSTLDLKGCSASFEGCSFRNNSAIATTGLAFTSSGGFIPTMLSLRNCSFVGGTLVNPNGAASVLTVSSDVPLLVEGCLFVGNSGGDRVVNFNGYGQIIRNCTFVSNQMSMASGSVLAFSDADPSSPGINRIENSIIVNNTLSGGSVPDPVLVSSATAYSVENSILETPGNAPTLVTPTFIDPMNGDYHLQPGSVGVDGGTWVGLSPTPGLADDAVDLDGNPRVRGSAVDMGCYEAQHIAYHPAVAGRVGETSGGPYDILEVNGSSGDMFRTVSVPLGTSSTVGMTQPLSATGPKNFAIFGMVGEAQFELVTTVPLGIGDMVFPPCPLMPFILDLFTLTNNFGGSCAQVIGSTLTPWVSAPFPPIGFPVTLTFQGIIEETPGVYVPTNAVIYKAE